MSNINITVINRIATYKGPGIVGENNNNYTISFQFDEEWATRKKVARFAWNGKYCEVPIENDECVAPEFPSVMSMIYRQTLNI